MLSIILLLLVGYFIYKVFGDNNETKNEQAQTSTAQQLEHRNYEWAVFIAKYAQTAKNKSQKELVAKMLADIQALGLPIPGEVADTSSSIPAPTPYAQAYSNTVSAPSSAATSSTSIRPSSAATAQIQLDNASLLLYFGAFLFVASAGLFVAFGALPGMLKTALVAFVSLVMYAGGIWIYRNKSKLRQAAIAFAGIGLAIAPLIGLAVYTYVFDQSQGAVTWFMTSIFCLGLYLHALITFRSNLLSYIFIFTLLSLFESAIAIVAVPIYYFGWGLALVGLALTAFVRYSEKDDLGLSEAARSSASIFLPLSVFVSLAFVGSEGLLQLGVSTLLAGVYYLLEATRKDNIYAESSALTSQILFLISVSAITYDVTQSIIVVSLMLMGANILQMTAVFVKDKTALLWQNFASVIIASQFIVVLFSLENPILLLISTVTFMIFCLLIWWQQSRTEAYMLGIITLMVLPLILGQSVLKGNISGSTQLWFVFAALAVQWSAHFVSVFKTWSEDWQQAADQLYIVSVVIVAFAGLVLAPWSTLLFTVLLAASTIVFAQQKVNQSFWAGLSGALLTIPLLHGQQAAPGAFLATALVALLGAIGLSIVYRSEFSRWWSTILWFIMPIAFAGMFDRWTAATYAWAYLFVALCLVLSRAIARGVVFTSKSIPLATFAKNASQSYVFGYGVALVVALFISLAAENTQIHTTAILTIIAAVVWLLATKIEKAPYVLVLLPLLLQAVLLSGLRPSISNEGELIAYLLFSSGFAAINYVAALSPDDPSASIAMQQGSLAAAFFAPASVFVIGFTLWPMPVGLLLASGISYHQIRKSGQASKELIGGLALLSLWWFMYWAGIRNIQAYSHTLALLFAGYAYWRTRRSQDLTADQYLTAMLATATIPLALQALSGLAGGLYGWWLLIEMIIFMLLGMTLNKGFVTKWGLYTAVAAVLYQLRNLGYLALAALAIFIIGIAIHKLLKYNDDK